MGADGGVRGVLGVELVADFIIAYLVLIYGVGFVVKLFWCGQIHATDIKSQEINKTRRKRGESYGVVGKVIGWGYLSCGRLSASKHVLHAKSYMHGLERVRHSTHMVQGYSYILIRGESSRILN